MFAEHYEASGNQTSSRIKRIDDLVGFMLQRKKDDSYLGRSEFSDSRLGRRRLGDSKMGRIELGTCWLRQLEFVGPKLRWSLERSRRIPGYVERSSLGTSCRAWRSSR